MTAATGARRNKRRIALILTIATGLLLATAIVHGFQRGPYVCNSGCLVRSPLIDEKTKNFIENEMPIIDRIPMSMWATGTEYIVCNSTHCTTYTMSFSGQYVGGERKRIEGNPPKAGGGGSGSGKSSEAYDSSSADGRDRRGGNARENERDGKDYVGRVTVGKYTRK